MEPLAVGTSVCVGEVIDRVREEGKVMEATTPGTFMMIEGDKVYPTFLEMLRDQPQMPDPVFKEGDVLPTIEDAGFPLDKMEEHDADFRIMYDEMFARSSEMGVMGAGDFEARLRALQNELSESKVENPNGGGTGILSTGESSVHTFERPATPFCVTVPTISAGVVVSPPEKGGDASDTDVDDRTDGKTLDA
jgi:hypothetical protein